MAFRTNKVPAIEERTVSGSSVSFNSAFALPLKACKVSFSATQSGSGTPSPQNIRPIVPVSSVDLLANSVSVIVPLGDSYGGGTLDLLTGKAEITHLQTIYNGADSESWAYSSGAFRISFPSGVIPNSTPYLCNEFNPVQSTDDGSVYFGGQYLVVRYNDLTTITAFKTFLQSNPLVIVYELGTPIELTLTPEQLSSIIGNNTFSTDTGTLEITFADLQEKSASGSVATFNTALAMPLASCNIAVNAWQEGSGDPYPAGGSAQQWDEVWELGYYANGIKTSSTTSICSTNKIKVTANTDVYMLSPIALYVTFYDTNGDYKSDISGLDEYGRKYVTKNTVLTIPTGVGYITFFVNQTTYSNNISINYPATDTAYHPYSNDRPIHGFSEVNAYQRAVNLWDEEHEGGTINTSTGANQGTDVYGERSKNFIAIKSNTSIYVRSPNAVNIFIIEYDKNKNFIRYNGYKKNEVYNVSADAYYIRFYTNNTTYRLDGVSINYPSTDTDYHAYTGNIYTIQFGEEVYGAEADVVNGVARVGWTLFDLGDVTWNYLSEFGIFQSTGTTLNMMKSIANNGVKSTMFCDTYKTYTYNQIRSDIGSISLGIAQRASVGIAIHDNSFNGDVEAFSNYISGHYVCFEISNPTDIQLTPTQIETLIGNNTIFADTGDIDLTYKDLDIAKRGNFREVFKLPS